MKKISIISLIAAFVAPAFAEESMAEMPDNDTEVIAEQPLSEPDTTPAEAITSSNPKIRFPHGMQIGVGVSVSSGLNGFIGYNGFPVLCDPLYGREKSHIGSVKDLDLLDFLQNHTGQMLHAEVLEFRHPVSGEQMHFKTKMPNDMLELKEILDNE